MSLCHRCKKEISPGLEVGRREECPFCHEDLHCCRNCKFHDPSAPKQCREPVAELVKEKEKANYCDYFVISGARGSGSSRPEPDAARKALENLFKK